MKKPSSARSKKNRQDKKGPYPSLKRFGDSFWKGEFKAMAGPCDILFETDEKEMAERLTQIAFEETLRIEQKFSRYKENNIVHKINSTSTPIKVDEETALLIEFANSCYELSNGLFDITSGILRKVWKFSKRSTVPMERKIDTLLKHVGWQKVSWGDPYITLPQGMEIDLGGICKEYAVDRVLLLLQKESAVPFLVNFGGDLAVSGPRHNGQSWAAGIENLSTSKNIPTQTIQIDRGALATSGVTHRFIIKDGKRYSHILNPKTGWPVKNAPASVTVADSTCTNAGILATLAMLQGEKAEIFLKEEGVKYWIIWE